jgi:hypothetical protein
MSDKSFVNPDKLKEVNAKVMDKGYVDREHLLEFLTSIETTDSKSIVKEVQKWLTDLHDDPSYKNVRFPQGDIDAIISDLDSYGRVQAGTILKFKASSSRTLTG